MLKQSKRKITRNFKDLAVRRKLTKEQENEVQDFYKGLIGRKVPLYSHEFFYSRTGIFSKEYIPTNLYYIELLSKANNYILLPAYKDKNMYGNIFYQEKQPHTILKNMNGYYYYENRPVSKVEAIQLCANINKAIIKPSTLSRGRRIQCISVKDGVVMPDGYPIAKLFDEYGKNFLIQDYFIQHQDLAKLNPTSVNTLRIYSYRSELEVLIVYAVIRIGRLNQVIDNQSAGGISVLIGEDGRLKKYAFGGMSEDNIEKTDTGIVLENYQIPSYDKAIEMVKRMHFQLPFFHLVGWDLSIDEDGEPVLIEFNVDPGLSQSAMGSGFGKHTERIIRELWPRPNTKYGC